MRIDKVEFEQALSSKDSNILEMVQRTSPLPFTIWNPEISTDGTSRWIIWTNEEPCFDAGDSISMANFLLHQEARSFFRSVICGDFCPMVKYTETDHVPDGNWMTLTRTREQFDRVLSFRITTDLNLDMFSAYLPEMTVLMPRNCGVIARSVWKPNRQCIWMSSSVFIDLGTEFIIQNT